MRKVISRKRKITSSPIRKSPDKTRKRIFIASYKRAKTDPEILSLAEEWISEYSDISL
jgi:hypothetical protein